MGEIDHRPNPATGYEIRVAGHLDDRWSARLYGLRLRHEPDGTTVIEAPAGDQAALHGVLAVVRDLGLPLVSVGRPDGHRDTPSADRSIGDPLDHEKGDPQ